MPKIASILTKHKGLNNPNISITFNPYLDKVMPKEYWSYSVFR